MQPDTDKVQLYANVLGGNKEVITNGDEYVLDWDYTTRMTFWAKRDVKKMLAEEYPDHRLVGEFESVSAARAHIQNHLR